MKLLQLNKEDTRPRYIAACILANVTIAKEEVVKAAAKKWDDEKKLELLNSYKQKARQNKTTILK